MLLLRLGLSRTLDGSRVGLPRRWDVWRRRRCVFSGRGRRRRPGRRLLRRIGLRERDLQRRAQLRMHGGMRGDDVASGDLSVMRVALGVVLVSLMCGSLTVHAQDVAAARTHYQAAVSYYESARYEDAVREFQTAYEITPRVELLFNISQCYERLGNLGEAIRYLESFVEGTDDETMRSRQQERLRNLRLRAQQAQPDPDPDPDPDPPDLGQVEPQTPPPPEPTTGAVRKAGFGVVAVGGAFALSFAVAGGMALAEDSNLSDRCDTEVCTSSDTDTLRRRMRFADASLAIGLVALTAGVLMIVLDKPSYDVALSPTGAQFRARF